MLKKRIIPIVLLDGFSVLKTIKFDERRNLGSPITVLRTYNTRNVDELILLDIDASRDGRSIDVFTVEEVASECFMPLTVGGGLKTSDDIALILSKGADKVSLNFGALDNPQLIKEASRFFGSQSIVVSIDVVNENGKYHIFKNGRTFKDIELLDWCKESCSLGAGELLINSVDRDGTMSGGDLILADKISQLVDIPVIYAGGISGPKNCTELGATNVSALGIASIFHFSSITPNECKLEMDRCKIPVRLK
jgi:imidazole glycerol-phosphate synthase subunit HisF